MSVGLIWTNVEEAIESYKKYEHSEALREEKIDKITDQSAETLFCQIVDFDILGS